MTGRFLSPDPAGLDAVDASNPSSWNRYTYVHGDPVNYNDKNGTGECAVGKSVPCTITVTGSSPPGAIPTPGYSPGSANGRAIPREPSPEAPTFNGEGGPKSGPAGGGPGQHNPCNDTADANFVKSNRTDAQNLANKLGVPVQWVLAVAANESS